MLPVGNWKLDAATLPRLDSNSNSNKHGHGQQASSSTNVQLPRAIFVRLSDELLQQLKAAQPGNASFQLELAPSSATAAGSTTKGNASAFASGSGAGRSTTPTPVALNLGDNSYPLVKPVNNSQSRTKAMELLIQSHSSSSNSSSLQLAASNIREQYEVGPSSTIRHNGTISTEQPKERTAANMGERLRERNAQMQKEKESRKIVIVEDDGFSSSGGKGKKSSNKHAKAQSSLLRANAISAKRSASPAAIPPKQALSAAPSAIQASTVSRPPSRLIANEAAKGLMKKSNMLQAVTGAHETKDTSLSMGSTATLLNEATAPINAAKLDTSVSQPLLPPINTTVVLDKVPAEKPKSAAPQGSPARRQFPQMKVDADDLASASSDSEDDDDAPLAVRIQSPIKTHFPVEPVSKIVTKPITHQSKMINQKPHTTPSPNLGKLAPKYMPAESSTSASESSDKETPKVARNVASTASIPKRLSPESAPNSRASSPGRSMGGPKTVAKTSGGSRLSRPVQKVSPRASPKPAAIPMLSSESSTSLASSASMSRPPSPPPTAAEQVVNRQPAQNEASTTTSAKLFVDSTLKPASRAPSPLPSPGLHPLPVKPPVSPSFKRNMNLQPSPNRSSPPPTVTAEKDKSPSSTLRPSLLSIGLPANPITGVMPNIPKSPSSLHPPTSSYPSRSHHPSSAHSTPGASPIVSHFPSNSSTRLSKSPVSGPLKSGTNGTGVTKRKDAPAADDGIANMGDSAANKKKKSNGGNSVPSAPPPLSATTGSEEDGEAEEEEGEYRPSAPTATTAVPEKVEKEDRGRSTDVQPVRSESSFTTSEKPRVISKGGLPSFTKKGRMSELQKEKGRKDSLPPRSQSASRANTPISFGSMDFDIPGGSTYKPKVTGALRITNDADFTRRSSEFQDKLYPEYMRLYTRLEEMKEVLLSSKRSNGAPLSLDCSPQQISRMVDEVNERSRELERIKVGLWQYTEQKEDRRDGNSRSNSTGPGMTKVK